MIEVRCDQTGDLALAPDEHSAFVAARTLCEDAWAGNPSQGYKPTATFLLDGEPLPGLARVPQPAIWRTLAQKESS